MILGLEILAEINHIFNKTRMSEYSSYTLDNIRSENNPSIAEPQYKNRCINKEALVISQLAESLGLIKHPSGGYFKETDRDLATVTLKNHGIRNKSTLIHFLMTCESPIGQMHVNVESRTIHVLQKGRGVYVLVYPNGEVKKFTVGFDVASGEVSQWVVPKGVYKGCYLVENVKGKDESNEDCLWVSEVVVPGFDFQDMKFLNLEELSKIIDIEKANKLQFLL